jgi:metal-responsive CopG/Arc/MetJ family transcriptional regulator
MRGRKIKQTTKRINVIFDEELLCCVDEFLDDAGLRKDKVTRSDFINDIINAAFIEFGKKGENSMIGREFPKTGK